MTNSRASIGKSAGTRTCPRRTSRLCLDARTKSRSHTGTGPPTPRWQTSLEVIRCFARMRTKERPPAHPFVLVRGREVAHRSLASATVARTETASASAQEQRIVLAPLSCRFAKTSPPASPHPRPGIRPDILFCRVAGAVLSGRGSLGVTPRASDMANRKPM